MATNPKEIQLDDEDRELLAKAADSVGKPWRQLLREHLANYMPSDATTQKGETTSLHKSLHDVLSERGMLGCFEGPTDLSTNPKHMEGFGRDAFGPSSD